MALKRLSYARLKEIVARQNETRWGADYRAAIEATPKEAPSLSRASILCPRKVGGREMHLLSPAERAFALLALYHPDVAEIHEQKVLWPEPRLNPLAGFAGILGTELAAIKGMIDVAERLGYSKLLPLVHEDPPVDPDKPRVFVFPFIGDLLLYLVPSGEHPYCINWNVKANEKAFKRPGPPNSKRHLISDDVPELPRNEMERAYYADAGIRTECLAAEHLDEHVIANLTQLFLHHDVRLDLSEVQRIELRERFATALETAVPPIEAIRLSITRGRFTVHQCRTYLWQAIWHRELRCDLFKPILIDRPLRRETVDVLDVYGDWFRRTV